MVMGLMRWEVKMKEGLKRVRKRGLLGGKWGLIWLGRGVSCLNMWCWLMERVKILCFICMVWINGSF